MLFADTALPFLLGNFSQWCFETGQMVDSRTGITAQQVTEPTADINNLTCIYNLI